MSLFLSSLNKYVGIILSDMDDRATEDTNKTLSKSKQYSHSQFFWKVAKNLGFSLKFNCVTK
jgi:hypothetical protein